ncbi:helix-turn-helix transcriptional regulator [Vagococcus salmoninarum]|uniref:Transcriptional regulator n=1 Tax=Vagococcus salmoninarum TaxID=2739 RepID=A0A429ZU17_9ENTE|nr:helix-turn-helix transcriptional regulator [Vagococcus salmoninarum]MBE9390253.1 helix-turn-helix transcriptional regulator [Vagococcus salmoninarum]RST97181.1 transcriptional regulator [Vagococcus salmoninarum]
MRQWLGDKRCQKEYTHADVANKTGIQRAYYTMIENGRRQPSVRVAKRIGQALEFEWTLFFENSQNQSGVSEPKEFKGGA